MRTHVRDSFAYENLRIGTVTWFVYWREAGRGSAKKSVKAGSRRRDAERLAIADADRLTSSLYLLSLEGAVLRVFAPGADFGNRKRRVHADFSYRGINYRLWVTDPLIEGRYLQGKDGDYSVGDCFVTVSLGEPHEGYCYKLVAALITR